MNKNKKPHPLDIHLGSKLRAIRTIHGLSQEVLASKLKLTFQQVQKYEKGQNRMSARTLYEISHIFAVSYDYFYEEYDGSPDATPIPQPPSGPSVTDYRFLTAFNAIPDPEINKALRNLVYRLAERSNDQENPKKSERPSNNEERS